MLFTPAERVLLLQILPPAEGSAVFLRGVRKLRKDLAFSDKEIIDWHVVSSPPTATSPGVCNWEGNEQVEIEISPTTVEYVSSCLKTADTAKKLHEGLIDLYDKFFPEA